MCSCLYKFTPVAYYELNNNNELNIMLSVVSAKITWLQVIAMLFSDAGLRISRNMYMYMFGIFSTLFSNVLVPTWKFLQFKYSWFVYVEILAWSALW